MQQWLRLPKSAASPWVAAVHYGFTLIINYFCVAFEQTHINTYTYNEFLVLCICAIPHLSSRWLFNNRFAFMQQGLSCTVLSMFVM